MRPSVVVEGARVFLGDCRDVLKTLPDNSVESVVTDPPYELGFMGKSWDNSGIAYDVTVWEECLRVLKPGGHILAFGGTRTWHRLAVAIEDAGFEIRDNIAWIYGSGFPKSLDVSKAIDKSNGKHEVDLSPFGAYVKEVRESRGLSRKQLDDVMGTNTAVSWWEGRASGVQLPSKETYERLKVVLGMDGRFDSLIDWAEAEREVIGMGAAQCSQLEKSGVCDGHFDNGTLMVKHQLATKSATPEAKTWQGWGTALKPAFEPVVVGRKPLVGTVAENVLAWGVGGLNIDGSRIRADEDTARMQPEFGVANGVYGFGAGEGRNGQMSQPSGRWPANVVLDEFTAGLLDEQSGVSKSPAPYTQQSQSVGIYGAEKQHDRPSTHHGDTGGASRFFLVADTLEHDRMSLCKHTNANNVATLLNTIRATSESSAPTNVLDSQDKLSAQLVRSAGIQCDSCATHIAADLVALKTLASSAETSPLFHRCITDFGSSTLNQSLVSLVEKWASTDTIPTMTDFSTLFGCVLLATDELTKPVSLESDNGRSRYIYQAKASRRDRNEGLEDLEAKDRGAPNMGLQNMDGGRDRFRQNFHPTVKPTQLMRYLIKLVTPEGGTVLDPFTGSGSTGKAALLDGYQFIGAELTEEYLPIIEGRLRWAVENRDEETLF